MNIAYSSSDSYAPIAGVSLYSLLANNTQSDEINVFVIENGFSNENKRKFKCLCEKFGRKLTLIPLSDIEARIGASVDTGRWNISTFARLFEASLLPDSVEKVIHIDCDTLVLSSLEPLWNIDLEEKTVAAAYDCIGNRFLKEIGLSENDLYVNAGNIVLNLKKIREDNTEHRFQTYIHDHSHLSFVDQAVLNACIPSEDKLLVPLEYNVVSIVYYVRYANLWKVKHFSRFYSKDEVRRAVEKPSIVHFTTCFMDGTRPWMENNFHPMLAKYLEMKSKSPWADEPLWKDNRSPSKRLVYRMSRVLPQTLVASAVGIIHNVIIPLKNRFKG